MFDDRKIISRFWKRQGGRPDDVPPPPPSDDEGPMLDPGEETESLKLNKGAIGRQARKKLRREYRRDKVQLKRHWQTVGTRGAGAESDAESSSELSSASSSRIPRRKTRLAISDDEDEVASPKRANGPPKAESKARIPTASSDSEDDEDAGQINSTLFVTPASNKQNAGVAGRSPVPAPARTQSSAAQNGKRPAPSSSTLTSESDYSDSDSDAVTAGPSCLVEPPSAVPPSTTAPLQEQQAATSSVSQSTTVKPPQKPPLASTSSSSATAATKKRDRPLAAASLQRVKNQIKPKPIVVPKQASPIRGPPSQNKTTAVVTSGTPTGAKDAASGTRPTADPPATKAPGSIGATQTNGIAGSTAFTSQSSKAPPSTPKGSLLDLIAGPVNANARPPNTQNPSSAPAKSAVPPGAASTDAAVAKGSYRGAHKNLSRIGLLPDAPPPMLANRGSGSLRGRGGGKVAPANASGHVGTSAAAAAAKSTAPSNATAGKDAAPGVSGVAAAAPSTGQTTPPAAGATSLPETGAVALAAPSAVRETSPAADLSVSFADEGEDFADLSVPTQAANKDPAERSGDASPARPSAVPNTPTRPRADTRAERSKPSLQRATGSNAAPLGQPEPSKASWERSTGSNTAPVGQPEPSPTWRSQLSRPSRTPPWQRESWLERPKWWGQSHYAGVWYAAHQQGRDHQPRRSPPAEGSSDRYWDSPRRDSAPHEPRGPAPAQPPPPPSSSPISASPMQSRAPHMQDPRRAKLIATSSGAGQEAGSGNTSPKSSASFAERTGSGSGNASPHQAAPPSAMCESLSHPDAREDAPAQAPQWMESWAKKTGAELVPPPPLRPRTRPPWEDQTRRAYARLAW